MAKFRLLQLFVLLALTLSCQAERLRCDSPYNGRFMILDSSMWTVQGTLQTEKGLITDKAYKFSQTGADFLQFAQTGETDVIAQKSWTVMTWIKIDSIANQNGAVFDFFEEDNDGNTLNNKNIYLKHINSENKLVFGYQQTAQATVKNEFKIDFAVIEGEWFHVAWTYNSGLTQSKFYVNGKEYIATVTGNASIAPIHAARNSLWVGKDSINTGNKFNGSVEEFFWFSEAFTVEQIQCHNDICAVSCGFRKCISTSNNCAVAVEAACPAPEDNYDEFHYRNLLNHFEGGVDVSQSVEYQGPVNYNALKFTGDNYRQFTIPSYTYIGGPISFSFWLKIDKQQSLGKVFDFGENPVRNNIALSALNLELKYESFSNQHSTNSVATLQNLLKDRIWSHIVISVQSDDSLRVYIDGGVKQPDNSINPNAFTTSSLSDNRIKRVVRDLYMLGKPNSSGAAKLIGGIDDFKVFKRPISGSQIQCLYNNNCQAPVLTTSISSNGRFIKITMDKFFCIYCENIANLPKDSALCASLFTADTLALFGASPQCEYIQDERDQAEIRVYFGTSHTVAPSQRIIFNDFVFKSGNNINDLCPRFWYGKEVESLAVVTPPKPQAILQIPQPKQPLCHDFIIYIREILNDAGYVPEYINYQQLVDQQQTLIDLLTASKNKRQITIPKSILAAEQTYKLSVTIKNTLQGEQTQNFNLEPGLLTQPVYTVKIDRFNQQRFHNQDTVYFVANIFSLACVNEDLQKILTGLYVVKWQSINNGGQIVEHGGQYQQGVSELFLPPFTHTVIGAYTIKITVTSGADNTQFEDTMTYYIDSVPLSGRILGGNRQVNPDENLILVADFNNYNVKEEQRKQGITYQWSCHNRNTNDVCKDKLGNALTFGTTTQTTITKNMYLPYVAIKMTVVATFSGQSVTKTAVISFTDHIVVPTLKVIEPAALTYQEVNINQSYQLQVEGNDVLQYPEILVSILYNDKVYATETHLSKKFTFTLWDHITSFNMNGEVIIRVTTYNPQFIIPATTDIPVQINYPPLGGQMYIRPNEGTSLEQQYLIELPDYSDRDGIAYYQYFIYFDIRDYQKENELGRDYISKKRYVLQIPTTYKQIYTSLPQGSYNTASLKHEVLILGQVVDVKGGITNSTVTVITSPNAGSVFDKHVLYEKEYNSILNEEITIQTQRLCVLAMQLSQMDNDGQQNNCSNSGKWNEKEGYCDCENERHLLDCSANDSEYNSINILKFETYKRLGQLQNLVQDVHSEYQIMEARNLLLSTSHIWSIHTEESLTADYKQIEKEINSRIAEYKIYIKGGLFEQGILDINQKIDRLQNYLTRSVEMMDHIMKQIQYMIKDQEEKNPLSTPQPEKAGEKVEFPVPFASPVVSFIGTTQKSVYDLNKNLTLALQWGLNPNQNPQTFDGRFIDYEFALVTFNNIQDQVQETIYDDPEKADGEENANTNEAQQKSYKDKLFRTQNIIYQQNPLRKLQSFPYQNQNEILIDFALYEVGSENANKLLDLNQEYHVEIKQKFNNSTYGSGGVVTLGKEQRFQNEIKDYCIAYDIEKDSWDHEACRTQLISTATSGNKVFKCSCKKIAPVTVINDHELVIGKKIIYYEVITKVDEFEFWTSAIFIVFLVKTLIISVYLFVGYNRDKIDRRKARIKRRRQREKDKEREKELQDKRTMIELQSPNDLDRAEASDEDNKQVNRYDKYGRKVPANPDDSIKKRVKQIIDGKHLDRKSKLMKSQRSGKPVDVDDIPSLSQIKENRKRSSQIGNSQLQKSGAFQKNYSNMKSPTNEKTSSTMLNNRSRSPTQMRDNMNPVIQEENGDNEDNLDFSQEEDNNQNGSNKLAESKVQGSSSPQRRKSYKKGSPRDDDYEEHKQRDEESVIEDDEENQQQAKEKSPENAADDRQHSNNYSQYPMLEVSKDQKIVPVDLKKSTPPPPPSLYNPKKYVIGYVLRIHELIGVYYYFDREFLRPFRYMLHYLKIAILLLITQYIVTETDLNIYHQTYISVGVSLMCFLPLFLIKQILKRRGKNIILVIATIIYLLLLAACLTFVVINALDFEQHEGVRWSQLYFFAYFIDSYVLQFFLSYIKLAVFNWTVESSNGCARAVQKMLCLDRALPFFFTE